MHNEKYPQFANKKRFRLRGPRRESLRPALLVVRRQVAFADHDVKGGVVVTKASERCVEIKANVHLVLGWKLVENVTDQAERLRRVAPSHDR
jgi:hypothetical protein